MEIYTETPKKKKDGEEPKPVEKEITIGKTTINILCLLYTSPSPRDATLSRMPSSA